MFSELAGGLKRWILWAASLITALWLTECLFAPCWCCLYLGAHQSIVFPLIGWYSLSNVLFAVGLPAKEQIVEVQLPGMLNWLKKANKTWLWLTETGGRQCAIDTEPCCWYNKWDKSRQTKRKRVTLRWEAEIPLIETGTPSKTLLQKNWN